MSFGHQGRVLNIRRPSCSLLIYSQLVDLIQFLQILQDYVARSSFLFFSFLNQRKWLSTRAGNMHVKRAKEWMSRLGHNWQLTIDVVYMQLDKKLDSSTSPSRTCSVTNTPLSQFTKLITDLETVFNGTNIWSPSTDMLNLITIYNKRICYNKNNVLVTRQKILIT